LACLGAGLSFAALPLRAFARDFRTDFFAMFPVY
jgi:hypothetical protein